MSHWSDCAVHNEPALPKGECDCGNDAPGFPNWDKRLKDKFPDGITPTETPFMQMLAKAGK